MPSSSAAARPAPVPGPDLAPQRCRLCGATFDPAPVAVCEACVAVRFVAALVDTTH